MRIAICTLAIGEDFKKASLPSQLTKKVYCEKHAYDYIDDESVYDNTRPIAWSKVLLLQKYLPQYDYVVWLDADAMIMNFEQKLEDKITTLMGDKDMMVQKPYPRINTGVLFIKNTEYSTNFLKRLYDQTEFLDTTKYGDWEQDAFIHMVETEPDAPEHIQVLSYEYEKDIQTYWFAFYWGFFILHLAGYRGRCDLLQRDIYAFCPIKLDTDTDETYQTRLEWLKHEYRNYVHNRMGF